MNQQAMPFFDSAEAATRFAIQASGKTLKEVGARLWPALSVAAAQTRLANSLNEHRDEKLSADEHMAVAVFCERFDWLHYACLRCGHAQPARVTPEARAAELQGLLFERAGEMRRLLGEIEALQSAMGGGARAAA